MRVVRDIHVKQTPQEAWDYLIKGEHLKLLKGVESVQSLEGAYIIRRREPRGLSSVADTTCRLMIGETNPHKHVRFWTEECHSDLRGELDIESTGMGTKPAFRLGSGFLGMVGQVFSARVPEERLAKQIEDYFFDLQWPLESLIDPLKP